MDKIKSFLVFYWIKQMFLDGVRLCVVPLLNQAGVSIQDEAVVSRELQTRDSHPSSGWGSLDCIMTGSYKEIR